ncbi:short-chain dehydrogenase [Halioglobus japonicus]|uniref:KR domain-containing protein n=1 Tax=Halioglobus japonicus TaxID=930805 RepID=A0AAP8SNK0_9GAMM|nr:MULTISPECIES: SDR family NAD(P)-dependent oxidoreductase [Halioglobus]AQA18570.1 short-chain dehydrogenase [Halioglobus japonicus]KZX58763.1 short-chain dehydrogenase [Halioglobus sp. HI00S01]PLW86594.1 KR domain-containing protein [Halioglobus japonicus]GHD12071.1 putative short chain dehydrogenase/reductase [Halioglobus japonicus]
MQDFSNKVAVVTGGASGIGRSIVKELLAAGARVVVGDVEQGALDKVLAEFEGAGEISGVVTDVSSQASVNALADSVYERYGVCHLLFNNAGVAAPSANVWETTENDWTWVHGVNVGGVMNGIRAFVPRMIEGGEEGHIINTSSGDGGISPLPYQSVYASSKAAVSCISECLAAQLQSEETKLGASIFYPSGGLLDTGIWTTDRNRPQELAREKPYDPVPTVADFKVAMEAAGVTLEVQDLDELARYLLQGIREKRFVIMIGVEEAEATLQERAARIGRAELPIDLAEIPQL